MSVYNIENRDKAQKELHSGYMWYEGQQAGLGTKFILQVKEYIKILRFTPELYPLLHKKKIAVYLIFDMI